MTTRTSLPLKFLSLMRRFGLPGPSGAAIRRAYPVDVASCCEACGAHVRAHTRGPERQTPPCARLYPDLQRLFP